MEVKLTSELEAFVDENVRSGRYLDASDVMRDALRKLEVHQLLESPDLEAALLEGLEGTPRPYGPETWERIRQAAREDGATQG